jgi:hypothetical protein
MQNGHRFHTGLITVVALGFLAGCEGGTPSVDSSNTEATVKGVVKINGVPATEGEISFDPANYKRKDVPQRSAPIGPDGTYNIKTLTGENQIRIGGSLATKKGIAARTVHTLEVKPGENTFNFEASEK